VRVVFDCAARFRGNSLNDELLQGPDVMNSLVGVLIQFRKERVAIVSDMEAMFHQVRVDAKDHNALRFIWWPDGDMSQSPIDFRMLVHVFGATSSPSCARFCLIQATEDNADEFDEVTVETVKYNYYVDHCIKSVATEKKAISLVSQLMALLAKGGFRLMKWLSNCTNVLDKAPLAVIVKTFLNLSLGNEPVDRVLDVRWNFNKE